MKILIFVLISFNIFAIDKSQLIIDSLSKKYQDTLLINKLILIGQDETDYDLECASLLFKFTLENSQKMNYKFGVAESKYWIASILRDKGEYLKSIQMHFEAIKENEILNRRKRVFDSYKELVHSFVETKNYKLADFYSNKLLSEANILKDDKLSFDAFNARATFLMEKENFDSAFFYFNKSLLISRNLKDRRYKMGALTNTANSLLRLKKTEKAISYYKEAFELSKDINHILGQIIISNNISALYSKINKLDEAIMWGKSGLEIAKKINSHYDIQDSYQNLKYAYFYKKDFKKAYLMWDSLSIYKDSLLLKSNNDKILELQTQYETEKKEQQIKLLEEENTIKTYHQIALAGGIGFISILGFVGFFFQRKVSAKNKLILESKLKQTQIEKEIEQVQAARLEEQVSRTENELSSLAQHITEKYMLAEEIKEKLEEAGKFADDKHLTSKLKEVLEFINRNSYLDEQRKDFEQKLDLGNSTFYLKLEQKFPELSINEKRLCSLIKMKLSSKQISKMLNIEAASVDTARSRLRKKLNIAQDISIIEFLNNV